MIQAIAAAILVVSAWVFIDYVDGAETASILVSSCLIMSVFCASRKQREPHIALDCTIQDR